MYCYIVIASDRRERGNLKGEIASAPPRNDTLLNTFVLILAVFFFFFGEAYGFSIPEKLEYDLTLAGIKIGSMTLETGGGNPQTTITAKANSDKWVSLFYGVDDSSASTIRRVSRKNPSGTFEFIPRTYSVNLSEGPHKIHKEFTFDQEKKSLLYIDHLNREKSTSGLMDLTFDPLSSLYYIRQLPLTVGKSAFVNVFNNKIIYKVEVQVLRKEKLETAGGALNTILIRSNMDSVGDGVLYYPGDIYIWLTDDEKRTPVLIEKKLKSLVDGNLPDFIKKGMPDVLKKKLSAGSIKATLVRK